MNFNFQIITTFLLLFICTNSNAQTTSDYEYSKISNALIRDFKLQSDETNHFSISNPGTVDRWEKLRSSGIVMTGAGVVVAAMGFKLILDNNKALTGSNQMPAKYYTGRVLLPVGAAVAAGGITLWSISAGKLRKANSKSLIFSESGAGVALRF